MGTDLKGSPTQGRAQLEKISAAINVKMGSHVVLPLNSAYVAKVLRLPFGVFELDWRCGGGLPLNRLSRIWGKPSSLKSTTCLRLIRNAQHFCRHCKTPLVLDPKTGSLNCACPNPRWTLTDASQFNLLVSADYDASMNLIYGKLPDKAETKDDESAAMYIPGDKGKKTCIEFSTSDRCEPFRCLLIDTEGSTDEAWAQANGVDTSLLLLMGGNWAEQVLDLSEELLMTNELDLVILDSLDMLTPGDTLQKALTQTPKMADKAGILTRAMQKWMSAMYSGGLLSRYAPTLVTVAQVRVHDIGKPWASLAPSGGWAVGHGVALDIKLEPKKYEYKGDSALFGNFDFKVAKSKVGGFPRSKGAFRYWLRPGKGKLVGDTEDMDVVIEYATDFDFIQKQKTNWVLQSQYLNGGQEIFKTNKAMVKFLNDNISVYMELRGRTLNKLIGDDIPIEMPSIKIDKEESVKTKKKLMKTVAQVKAERDKKSGKKKSGKGLNNLLDHLHYDTPTSETE